MNAGVQRILALLIVAFGLFVASAYAVLVAMADNRNAAVDEWGTLAGFGLFAAIVGLVWLILTLKQQGAHSATVRLPPAWLSLFLFLLLVGAGFGLQIVERGGYAGPLLAVLAFCAVAAFFLRVAAHWMPERRLTVRNLVMPGVWGVFVAPMILLILQGGAIVMLALGVVSGIVADNPEFELDPNLDERISNYLEESDSGATSTAVPDVVETPTVAMALFSLVAVLAPLSEELIKAAGALLLISRLPVVSRSDAFQAAVAAGLGFAIFEGIGYTLASPSSWHQLILIRAPVVVMHVVATTIVVIGWYRSLQTGRGFLPYFVAAVVLHAGWNALAIGFVYSLAGIESGSDPSTGQALAVLAVALTLGALLLLAAGWFVSAARKSGLSARRELDRSGSLADTPYPSNAILGTG